MRLRKIRKKSSVAKPKREGDYNIPNEAELAKLQKDIEKHSKHLDENGRPPPLTENEYKQLIRSAVREKWMYCDSKLAFLLKNAEPDYDTNTRRRMKWQCHICKEWYNRTEVEIDHHFQEETFRTVEDGFKWASSILNAGGDDLNVLCVADHSVKTLLDGLKLDYTDPVVWQWGKMEKAINDVFRGSKCPEKKWLQDRGVVPGKNNDVRRQQVKQILEQEMKDGK